MFIQAELGHKGKQHFCVAVANAKTEFISGNNHSRPSLLDHVWVDFLIKQIWSDLSWVFPQGFTWIRIWSETGFECL